MSRVRSGTIAGFGACALAALLGLAAPALGAPALKSGVYRGFLAGVDSKISISLRVSAGGTQIAGVTLSALPIYCSGNGPPGTPSIVFAKAKISDARKFTTTGKDMIGSGPLKGSVAATFSVTGTFTAAGSVHGTLTTSFEGDAKSCGGHSSYIAHD
jgi:hypothetical protein